MKSFEMLRRSSNICLSANPGWLPTPIAVLAAGKHTQ